MPVSVVVVDCEVFDDYADVEQVGQKLRFGGAPISWFNHSRLMHRLGRIPPAEAEDIYHAGVANPPVGSHTTDGA